MKSISQALWRKKMDTGFDDPIGLKKVKTQKSPWDFECPPYDQRSSCFVNAGTNFGVGHKTPVGKMGRASSEASTLPNHKVKTMRVGEIYEGSPEFFEVKE